MNRRQPGLQASQGRLLFCATDSTGPSAQQNTPVAVSGRGVGMSGTPRTASHPVLVSGFLESVVRRGVCSAIKGGTDNPTRLAGFGGCVGWSVDQRPRLTDVRVRRPDKGRVPAERLVVVRGRDEPFATDNR